MSIRDSLLDNFAGDLEYHPCRGAIYLFLAAAALGYFYFSPAGYSISLSRLPFALGGLTLLIKGVFLFRKSSEGIGLTEGERKSVPSSKNLPPLPNVIAQIVQDFGAGSLLLWPLLRVFADPDDPRTKATEFQVFLAGAILFGLGWLVRRATTPASLAD